MKYKNCFKQVYKIVDFKGEGFLFDFNIREQSLDDIDGVLR